MRLPNTRTIDRDNVGHVEEGYRLGHWEVIVLGLALNTLRDKIANGEPTGTALDDPTANPTKDTVAAIDDLGRIFGTTNGSDTFTLLHTYDD